MAVAVGAAVGAIVGFVVGAMVGVTVGVGVAPETVAIGVGAATATDGRFEDPDEPPPQDGSVTTAASPIANVPIVR